MDFKPMTYLR